MAIELGVAYISILPSTDKLAAGIKSSLKEAEGLAKTAGKNMGEEIDSGSRTGIKGMNENLKKSLVAGAAVAGALAGKAIGAAIGAAMEQDAGNDKLAASLGLNSRQSKRAGQAAGQLYKSGFGESVADTQDIVKNVLTNIPSLKDAGVKQMGAVLGKVATISDVFDQDSGAVAKSAKQLVNTGLAKNLNQAFDVITVGFQNGDDASEDFLDTINEYGTQFRKLGIDGKTMTSIISQGLQGGARDGDLVADSFKEFSIRAVDGSKTTAAGFKALGINADQAAKQIGKGGPAAKAMTADVLDRLRAIKDPIKQQAAGVALFGTQYEDMGKAILNVDLNKPAKGFEHINGAADKAGKTAYNNATSNITGFIRTIKQGFIEAIGGHVLPVLNHMAQFVAHNSRTFKVLGTIVGVTVAAIGIYKGVVLVTTKVTRAWAVVQKVLNGTLKANPIGLVITVLALLVTGLIVAYKKSDTFRAIVDKAWNGIKDAIQFAWERVIKPVFTALKTFITDTLPKAFRGGVDKIGQIWDGLKAAARKPVEFLVNTVYNNGIRAMMNKIPGVSLPEAHFAKGGPVSGGIPGRDSVNALMMPGEHVLTAKEVKNAGGHRAIFRLRELLANGRFSGLGDLGRSTAKGGGHLPRFADGGGLTADQIARAQAFAKAQAGKPYIWGGVGPGGYDCSGFMSAITNVLRGNNPYSRVGTSGSFPWAGFQPGWGEFTVGAFTGSPGHVAGTLGGMNVESTNGSVRVGAAARGAGDPMFTRIGHLGAGGDPAKIAAAKKKEQETSDHWWDIVTEVPRMAKGIFNDIRGMASSGWFGEFRKAAMSFMDKAVSFGDDHLPDKIGLKFLPDINLPDDPIRSALKGLGVFDNGGILKPGQLAYNASNKPEAVFNHEQFKQYARGGSAMGFPKTLTLEVEGQRFNAYVRDIARDEIDDDASYSHTVRGMGR